MSVSHSIRRFCDSYNLEIEDNSFPSSENCKPSQASVPNGYLSGKLQSGGSVAPGHLVTVTCNTGFEHVQSGGEQLTCVSGNIYNPGPAKGCKGRLPR